MHLKPLVSISLDILFALPYMVFNKSSQGYYAVLRANSPDI